MKLRFLPFFRRFHAANGDLGSGNFVPPPIQPPRNRIFSNRRLCAEVPQFFLPALGMALFRFRHSQENALAFLVPCAFGQIAIHFRRLDCCRPIARGRFGSLLSFLSATRRCSLACWLSRAESWTQ